MQWLPGQTQGEQVVDFGMFHKSCCHFSRTLFSSIVAEYVFFDHYFYFFDPY